MVLESPLNSKEVKSVNPKGNQPWIFIGRYETEAAAPIFWPTDMKSQLIGKDLDAGKYWRWEEKGMTEGEIVVTACPKEFMEASVVEKNSEL